MARGIVVLSGPICAGKTELGNELIRRFPERVHRFKTHEWIQERQGASAERDALQGGGEELDRRTKGYWVRDELARRIVDLPSDAIVLVDAARIKSQIDGLRDAFGAAVTHVHLKAPDAELEKRFKRRRGQVRERRSFRTARRNATERAIDELEHVADLVIDSNRNTPTDLGVRVASRIGLYAKGNDRLVDVLVGGQYGSEGKGQVAAYLSREYDVLVRVGGPNAGHSVYGRPPTKFRHLPSGTIVADGARIVLGPGAVLRLDVLSDEIAEAQLDPGRLSIDPQAMIIEAKDRRFEKKLVSSIGSTGQGVGAATARKVLRGQWHGPVCLAKDHPGLADYIRETADVLEKAYARGSNIFLEGTQGTALSLHHGRYPHVTSRDTTVGGCLAEAGIAPSRVNRIVLVCRSYPIRVQDPDGGTSGEMSREISWAEVARRCDYSAAKLRRDERTTTTNRQRRVAEFDWSLFRRSVSLNGPTDVALTFADYIGSGNQDARRFEQLNAETIRFIQEMEGVSSAPVSLIATRFHYRSIIDRRAW